MWILFTLAAVSSWALVSVLDSLLVHHFESRPFVISWSQSIMSVPLILAAGLVVPTLNPWFILLLFTGLVTNIGDILFWRILKITDVSTTYFVGVFLAMIMVTIGVLQFHEPLTAGRIGGAVLILSGVTILALSKQGSLTLEALLLMFCAAFLFAPFYIVQKWMMDDGQTFSSTFFWMILGRELTAFSFSLLHPGVRRQILVSVPRQPRRFFVFNFISITLFLFAMYCMSQAYALGEAFLVSLLANVQPFIVIILAGICAFFAPKHAPRELFTALSIRMKVVCFSLVFLGLALIGVSAG